MTYTLTVDAQDMPMILGALREVTEARAKEGKPFAHLIAFRLALIRQRDAQTTTTESEG